MHPILTAPLVNRETMKLVRASGADWARSGCGLASEIILRDMFPLPIPHSERDARWCVFMTHDAALLGGERFLTECWSKAEAEAVAAKYRRVLESSYDAALAAKKVVRHA